MAKLIVKEGEGPARDFLIGSGGLFIGRNPDNDIRINTEQSSRKHCRVRSEKGKFLVEDLNSSNGTFVNDRRVYLYALQEGDVIRIGNAEIRFEGGLGDGDRTMALPTAEGVAAVRGTKSRRPTTAPRRGITGQQARIRTGDQSQPKAENNGGAKNPAEIATGSYKSIEPGRSAKTEEDASKSAEIGGSISARRLPAGSRPTSRPTIRSARPRSHANEMAKLAAFGGVFVLAALLAFNYARSGSGHTRKTNGESTNTSSDQTNLPGLPGLPDGANATNLPRLPKTAESSDTAHQSLSSEFSAELEKVLAERDKALAASNFLRARALLTGFLAAHENEPALMSQARKELEETNSLIQASMDQLLADAQAAANEKRYRLTTQRCTAILSVDPRGTYGEKARAILNQNDEQSEPRFRELHGQAIAEAKCGELENAMRTLSRALDEVGGTKWATIVSDMQLQVLMVRNLVKRMEAQRVKLQAAGQSVPIEVASRNITGTVAKINELMLSVQSGPAVVQFPMKAVEPDQIFKLCTALKVSGAHLEIAYLWQLLGQYSRVQSEVELALKTEQSASATRLADAVSNIKNVHSYDFSKWQNQSDWEAQSGSWCTLDDKYVCEGADGGDTTLMPAAIGGLFPTGNADISFDFELRDLGPGYFFACEFGSDERNAISLLFSVKGVTVTGLEAGSRVQNPGWQPAPTHVEFSITNNELRVTINDKAMAPLLVPRLAELKGTLTFRTREAGAAIDNVLLRTIIPE